MFRPSVGIFALLAILCIQVEASDKVAGKIELVKGEVYILDAKSKVVADVEGKRGRFVKAGAPFYEGETVQTKDSGRVKLAFLEGNNMVVLGTNTSLLIERASGKSGESGTDLRLARGEVRSQVNRKYSGEGQDVFQVKTANAVAGVRGTVFTTVFKEGKTDVFTEKGAVMVSNGAGVGAVLVKVGSFTSMSSSTPTPTAPAPIADNPTLAAVANKLANPDAAVKKADDTPGKGVESKEGGPAAGTPGADAGKPSGEAAVAKGGDAPAPLGREPASKESAGRGPASEGGGNTPAPPKLLGDKFETKGGPNAATGNMGPQFGHVGFGGIQDKLNDDVRRSQEAARQNNESQNAMGKVKFVIE